MRIRLPWRALLPLAVLNALLGFGNLWPSAWPMPQWQVSVELAFAVLGLSLWVGWRGSLARSAVTSLAALGTVWVVLHYADVTVPALLGRRLNLYWDAPHLGAVLRMGGEAGALDPVLVAVPLTVALLVLLHVVVRRCITALADQARRAVTRWLMLSLALATIVAWLGPATTRQAIATPVAGLLHEQYRLLSAAWSRGTAANGLGASPRFAGDLGALDGADVLVVFAEAYGAVTFDDVEIAAALRPARNGLARAIATSGRRVVSARVVSPTFGGASWLAHAALLAGIDTRDPSDYERLLTTDRPTLVSHFAAHGYRTVAWMPGLQRPWPEGAFYRFDRYADADGIGYAGPHFGFWRIPDQAAMAQVHVQEFGGRFDKSPGARQGLAAGTATAVAAVSTLTPRADREHSTASRVPRFIVFPTLSTHAPFRAIPPLLADWQALLRADAYSPEQVEAAIAAPVAWTRPRPAYVESMRYQFAWLADYLEYHAPPDLLLIVIGDHQPLGSVAGPDQAWDVPVHVISRNRMVLDRLASMGFVDGIRPAPATIGPMHGLTRRLADAFSASD